MKYLTIFAILFAAVLACAPESDYFKKKRLAFEAKQNLAKTDSGYYSKRNSAECNELRAGAAPGSNDWNWRPIKIHFDLSRLFSGLKKSGREHRIPFYQKVFDVTNAWYNKAVMVRDKKFKADGVTPIMSSALKLADDPLDPIDMGGKSPDEFDLIIEVGYHNKVDPKMDNVPSNTLAFAGPSGRHECTRRAIFGGVAVTEYGDNTWVGKVTNMNDATTVIIHEFAHIVAFLQWDEYQAVNTKEHAVLGFLWTGPKLLEKARAHWGCKAGEHMEGVPLEVEIKGGKKVIGAHFSEQYFGTEAMTPVVGGDPDIVSEMTLALFEDSSWYKANYGMAEKWTFGQGNGCDWLSCKNQRCKPDYLKQFPSMDRTSVATCANNGQDNSCGYELPQADHKCTNPATWLNKLVEFGASFGDKCTVVHGNFRAVVSGEWEWPQEWLSVQSNCAEDKGSYTLTFKDAKLVGRNRGGDEVVTCTAKGPKEYNLQAEFKSSVDCEDPQTFCSARFAEWQDCPQDCGYEGRCAHRAKDGNGAFVQAQQLSRVSRMMLGGTRTVKLSQSSNPANVFTNNSGKTENNWQCWCYSTKNWSQQADGSCPNPVLATAAAPVQTLAQQRNLQTYQY